MSRLLAENQWVTSAGNTVAAGVLPFDAEPPPHRIRKQVDAKLARRLPVNPDSNDAKQSDVIVFHIAAHKGTALDRLAPAMPGDVDAYSMRGCACALDSRRGKRSYPPG
jgi:hypothetical protein